MLSQRFIERHIGTNVDDQRTMLDALGYASITDLLDAAVPSAIRVKKPRSSEETPPSLRESALPLPATETEAIAELRELAARNTVRRSMIGLGYYNTITPAVIKRNVLENPSWYTAYTPYQPEISQGRLEALINFQTMIADLTGLDTANASMLDESTAVVEGMLLARRASKLKVSTFIVDAETLPQTKVLLNARAEPLGIMVLERDLARIAREKAWDELPEAFGIFIQYPSAHGQLWNPASVIKKVREAGGIAIVAADLLALALVAPPGELGADVAVGTSQRFGVPLGFGGPHAGYLAVRSGLERQMPGRLVGVSQDADGNPGYRLSLQAREQHIRREKATSNICTAQVLLAIMASMYAVYHGPNGIRDIARSVHSSAVKLADTLRAGGVEIEHAFFFDTLALRVADSEAVVRAALSRNINLYAADATRVLVSVDETTTEADIRSVALACGVAVSEPVDDLREDNLSVTLDDFAIPDDLRRASDYLGHEVFNSYHSETSMMRYLKRLADKDYALDRGMIPLGSCTMKLNAATEMESVSWPEFAGLHPFAPEDDVAGTLELIMQLERWLADVTGYDTVSLQPNAGSQGELAGLLAIRGYHRSRGEQNRTVCLIPSSAHGTNAASAVLAGMSVVVVACDEKGNIDLGDLQAKIDANADRLAALMITYPSTHGVYEGEVAAIIRAAHDAGAQVYVDGANLNALLGYARFGDFGGDVSHLNLHKTFSIPHGGGGPGIGPVAAKAHLAPFLPGHPMAQRTTHAMYNKAGGWEVVEHGGPPVAAAPYGSASILPISWAYVRMMGESGLVGATGAAVLAANYIATRLREYYPVLYTGDSGLVAHECILDLRPLKEATGITVEDVAKRLIDYGFHAPTMSFPVASTLMVEPTESENLAELDRFIDAMIAIRREAEAVGRGDFPPDDNPLRGAPHTAHALISGAWEHSYTREQAAYPVAGIVRNKYWPPVRRIDQAYGDRNLVCSCPSPEAFI
ncbi:aminomethyl-transferring glycine dehydrogenase [Lysinibacter sp. HNR]|uniref:aminomethyl-transferring glycine dehydrogenase n=1 Tax=Lysinibacter sp. HNR TaxID=3031408 RepID=UPI0024356702|nr:aminomethyl-transferring glycine dehydrogenase [Lysinibacter sp. HNR]WGD38349.1 aminomethyl-transferring glycine dehydrogenase [Lysinibacter sp. HNR]